MIIRHILGLLLLTSLLSACQILEGLHQKAIGQDPEEISQPDLKPILVLFSDLAPAATFSEIERPFTKELRLSSSANQLKPQQADIAEGAYLHAQMLANLIGGLPGHEADIKPASSYTSQDYKPYERVFYLGTLFDSPVPEGLIIDLAEGAPVTWIGYNIWQVDNPSLGTSLEPFGLKFISLRTAYNPGEEETTFNRILYNGYTFYKDRQSMDMVEMQADPTRVLNYATAQDASGNSIPYALQSGKLWYIADMPFIFIYERDRYLVFADLLAKMMGTAMRCEPQAVLRIEDVSPNTPNAELKRLTDTLEDLNVPFGIATIPYYVDETPGAKRSLNWQDNPVGLERLKTLVSNGKAEILQHGTTHQTDAYANPSGISGLDWEFWDVNTNAPLDFMTASSATERIKRGKTELERLGLSPSTWVTPHYSAPADYYDEFKTLYWRFFERRPIRSGSLLLGQFFPYPIRDIYKRGFIIPENTNVITESNTLATLYETAKANSVLRCPWLGLFVHSFLLDPSFESKASFSAHEYKRFINDLKSLGYTFTLPRNVELNRF